MSMGTEVRFLVFFFGGRDAFADFFGVTKTKTKNPICGRELAANIVFFGYAVMPLPGFKGFGMGIYGAWLCFF